MIETSVKQELNLGSLTVEELELLDIPAILEIADDQLGKKYLSASDFLSDPQHITLVAKYGSRILGFLTAGIEQPSTLIQRFQASRSTPNPQLKELGRELAEENAIGYLASTAVHRDYVGMGIGTALGLRAIEILNTKAVSLVVATAWKSSRGVNAAPLLKRLHFNAMAVIPNYWMAASVQEGFSCPVCGTAPCKCSAVLYTRRLDNQFKGSSDSLELGQSSFSLQQ